MSERRTANFAKEYAENIAKKGYYLSHTPDDVEKLKYEYYFNGFMRSCFIERFDNDDVICNEELHDLFEYVETYISKKRCVCIDNINEYISLLVKAKKLNKSEAEQYFMVRDFIINHNLPEAVLIKIYNVLFEIQQNEEASYPLLEVLHHNIGKFAVEYFSYKSTEDIISSFDKTDQFRKDFILFAIPKIPKDSVKTWEYSFDDTAFTFDNLEEPTIYENFSFVSNTVIRVTSEIFDKLSDVKLLPWYYTDDEDKATVLIGNRLTFVEENNSNKKITYLIVDKSNKYSSFKVMFEELGTETFGIYDCNAFEADKKCKDFFENISDGEKAVALFVIRAES